MHIQDILQRDPITLSIEFFPPKTDEASKTLDESLEVLSAYKPSFIDLTYGAGGTTRDITVDKVGELCQAGHDVVPHLTTVCQKEADIRTIIERYAEQGVSNILRCAATRRAPCPTGIASRMSSPTLPTW